MNDELDYAIVVWENFPFGEELNLEHKVKVVVQFLVCYVQCDYLICDQGVAQGLSKCLI